jgi:PLP dependent protein
MNILFAEFEERVAGIRERLRRSCENCGRDPAEVVLLPVTKTHPVEAARFAARAGFASVGENRVQEALEKMGEADFPMRWELIGHLQSNKARVAAESFSRIQSVDSIKLIRLLDRHAGEAGRSLPVLLQVNAGNDPAKFGADVEEAPRLLEAVLGAQHLRVEGFMTIAPLSESRDVARGTFARLRELRDQLAGEFAVSLPELSMGMTGDLEEAVEEGSTVVRVGTALFGRRE